MLNKQSLTINFQQGLDTKSDPLQVSPGRFLSLTNTVFTKGGLLQKRNGFAPFSSSIPNGALYLTTFNNNLTALGSSLQAFNQASETWVNKGNFRTLSLSTLPLVRSALSQIQCDAIIAQSGLVCTVYTESNNGVNDYAYVIADSVTGQNIAGPVALAGSGGTVSGSPRVFLLGGYFIIAYDVTISSAHHLQYLAVSSSSPTISSGPTDIAVAYQAYAPLSWDAVTVGSQLFFAYPTTTGGQQIAVTYLTQGLVLATPVSFTSQGSSTTIMSMSADVSGRSPVVYAAWMDQNLTVSRVAAVDLSLNVRMTPTNILTGVVNNITSCATEGTLTLFWESNNNYGYDASVPSHLISTATCTLPATVTTGAVGAVSTVLRSVGLASKAFLINSIPSVLTEYCSPLQNTYFLTDRLGNISSKFAYENGGAISSTTMGYLPNGLPTAQVSGELVTIAYLYKDLIQSTSTAGLKQSIGTAGASNIYSQTGLNLVTFNFSPSAQSTTEIGANLNIAGGFLWAYDGNSIQENGFHLFPDSVEASYTASTTETPTGTASNGAFTITLSSVVGVYLGMSISDTTNPSYVPAGTYITALNGSVATMSNATAHAISGDTLSISGNVAAKPDGATNTNAYYYQALYEWTDAQGNIFRSAPSVPISVSTGSGSSTTGLITVFVPTLRLTAKTNVKIILYRWSVANQTYYQVTSVVAPTLNDKTVDYITYIDTQADSSIIGNSVIYTTGGVLEDIGAPSANALTLFDDRLWLIDAEDTNLLWYSKQVLEATPVEMSDLLTLYIAPSTGAQGSTGALKCIAPMDDKLILFKKEAIYYINGSGPDNTGANSQYSQPIYITSTVGSANQNSIVLTPAGLMFQSDKGIWLLGRDLSTSYIGAPVEAYNNFTVNSALAIPGTNQVRFTLSSAVTLMYDYYFGQWTTFSNVNAISSTLYQGLHTYVSSSSSVFQETPGAYTDNGNPTLMSFTTSWFSLANLQGFERTYFFYLLGTYYSPHKLQIGIAYDYDPSVTQQSTITPDNANPTYGNSGIYGDGSPYGGTSVVEQWRVFMQKQKCQAFQLTFNEIYDASYGIIPGAGFTLSGLNLVVATKKGYATLRAAKSVG